MRESERSEVPHLLALKKIGEEKKLKIIINKPYLTSIFYSHFPKSTCDAYKSLVRLIYNLYNVLFN